MENLISQGANVLVVLAQDGTAVIPAVQDSISQGIPVIAYDRLIEDPGVLYITFDNQLVGEMQAQALFDIQPSGNWVIIKGNSADANADFLRAGAEKVIGEAVAARRHHHRRRGLHRQLGSRKRPDHDGAVPDRREQRHPGGARPERRHGRWRDRGTRSTGPRRPGARVRARTATSPP